MTLSRRAPERAARGAAGEKIEALTPGKRGRTAPSAGGASASRSRRTGKRADQGTAEETQSLAADAKGAGHDDDNSDDDVDDEQEQEQEEQLAGRRPTHAEADVEEARERTAAALGALQAVGGVAASEAGAAAAVPPPRASVAVAADDDGGTVVDLDVVQAQASDQLALDRLVGLAAPTTAATSSTSSAMAAASTARQPVARGRGDLMMLAGMD